MARRVMRLLAVMEMANLFSVVYGQGVQCQADFGTNSSVGRPLDAPKHANNKRTALHYVSRITIPKTCNGELREIKLVFSGKCVLNLTFSEGGMDLYSLSINFTSSENENRSVSRMRLNDSTLVATWSRSLGGIHINFTSHSSSGDGRCRRDEGTRSNHSAFAIVVKGVDECFHNACWFPPCNCTNTFASYLCERSSKPTTILCRSRPTSHLTISDTSNTILPTSVSPVTQQTLPTVSKGKPTVQPVESSTESSRASALSRNTSIVVAVVVPVIGCLVILAAGVVVCRRRRASMVEDKRTEHRCPTILCCLSKSSTDATNYENAERTQDQRWQATAKPQDAPCDVASPEIAPDMYEEMVFDHPSTHTQHEDRSAKMLTSSTTTSRHSTDTHDDDLFSSVAEDDVPEMSANRIEHGCRSAPRDLNEDAMYTPAISATPSFYTTLEATTSASGSPLPSGGYETFQKSPGDDPAESYEILDINDSNSPSIMRTSSDQVPRKPAPAPRQPAAARRSQPLYENSPIKPRRTHQH